MKDITSKKTLSAIPKTRLVDLDEADRKFVSPRVQKIMEGRKAEVELDQYVSSILRRSGYPGAKYVLDRASTKILVTPDTGGERVAAK